MPGSNPDGRNVQSLFIPNIFINVLSWISKFLLPRRSGVICGLVLGSLWLAPAYPAEDRLDQIAELAEVGASRFALHLLDRFQPNAAQSPDIWMHWERERTLIYRQTHAWRSLIERADQRPANLPDDFLRWHDTRVAEAWLELGEVDKARDRLLSLIWRTPPSQRGDYFARWRELIVRVYLAEGRYHDAHTAWLRYRLDYANSRPADAAVSTEVLLRIGQIAEASAYLVSPESGRERLLAAIIESELGLLSTTEMWQRVEALLSVGRFDPTLALEAWIALERAAARGKDIALGCQVLERALTLAHLRPAVAQEAGITGDGLWQCYELLAGDIANANQLLVGRFDEWLALIDTGLATPVETRALLAFLVLNGSQAIRDSAEPRLIDGLRVEPRGARVLQGLYLSSSRAQVHGAVPETARYPLIELALDEGGLALARQLADGLDRSSLIAKLVRARIQLHKSPDSGASTIRSLFASAHTPSSKEVDGFRVAINELGGMLPEDEVLDLLEQLHDKAAPVSDSGEILLSIAAIEMRQLKFQQAAISYLKASRATADSATERQALVQAARALSLGRMNEQAREIYRQLLNKPLRRDERRQISRELERLGIAP